MEGKDGSPLNEVRVLCNSLMFHDGRLRADKSDQAEPGRSVLKLQVGDEIRLNENDFRGAWGRRLRRDRKPRPSEQGLRRSRAPMVCRRSRPCSERVDEPELPSSSARQCWIAVFALVSRSVSDSHRGSGSNSAPALSRTASPPPELLDPPRQPDIAVGRRESIQLFGASLMPSIRHRKWEVSER